MLKYGYECIVKFEIATDMFTCLKTYYAVNQTKNRLISIYFRWFPWTFNIPDSDNSWNWWHCHKFLAEYKFDIYMKYHMITLFDGSYRNAMKTKTIANLMFHINNGTLSQIWVYCFNMMIVYKYIWDQWLCLSSLSIVIQIQ